jgi:hypothetical protein
VRTEEEITANLRPGKAFSNGTQWEIWSYNWCERCKNNDEETELWCPIITVALLHEGTPAEWTEPEPDSGVLADYVCTEFDERREGDDEPEPEPEPEPPPGCDGQVDMFEVFADQIVEQIEQPTAVS